MTTRLDIRCLVLTVMLSVLLAGQAATAATRIQIDEPAPDAHIDSTFVVRGWAVDFASTIGSGIDAVHIYAYPANSSTPIGLGVATIGGSRPDVANVFGPQFTNAGYTFTATGLAPGTYLLVVFARSSLSGVFTSQSQTIIVNNTVAHDTTLVGNGTHTSPLGIASNGVGTAQLTNAAVSAPKLGTAAPPVSGQVLSFDGVGLAWQNPPVGFASGIRIVDSGGHVVGPYVSGGIPGGVLLKIGGTTFGVSVDRNGFVSINAVFLYKSADCSGTPYLPTFDTIEVTTAVSPDSLLMYYATAPYETITSLSWLDLYTHTCNPRFYVQKAGPVASFDLSSLGFVPPFHMEF